MHGWENLRDEDRDTILEGIEAGRALGGPFHVELDPIDICNADCFFCNSAEIRNGAILKWDRLSVLADELVEGGLRSFRIAGGGEPLIYPQLGELMDKMSAAGAVMDNVTTNGLRLIDPVIDHLLKTKITHVLVSLNYATEESYGRFMRIPGDRFQRVVEGIHRLDRRLREAGRREETLIQTQFMIHRSTVSDLDAMMDLSSKLPVDAVTLLACGLIPQEEELDAHGKAELLERLPGFADHSRGRYWLELNMDYAGIQPQCEAIIAPIHSEGKDPPAASPFPPGTIEYCFIGWYSMLVQGTGEVHPCCFLLPDQRVPSFGNLNESSVSEVWNGPLYERHRQEMRTAMLMEERTPGQIRRFKCTLPFCWKHDECVLSHQLADPAFYLSAHERLEQLRNRPLTRAARVANRTSRQLINSGKSLTGQS